MWRRFFGIFVCILGISSGLLAPPRMGGTNTQKIQNAVNYLRHEQENMQVELRLLDGKVNTCESVAQQMRQELEDFRLHHKKAVTSSVTSCESKLDTLQKKQQALISDMRDLKTFANELSASVTQSRRKLKEFEELIEGQNRNIAHLEAAFQSFAKALELGDPSSELAYKVRPGDTLEKIARAHGVTIQAIKQSNSLSGDLIRVGQTLQIPR